MRGKDGDPSLEDLLRTDDGTRGQSSVSGQAMDLGLCSELVGLHDSIGPSPLTAFPRESGSPYFGLPPVKDYGRALDKLLGGPGLGGRGPALSLDVGEAQLGVACLFNWSSPSNLGGLDQSMSSIWVFDGLWRPSAEEQSLEENSKTDCALMEEASRYGNASNFFGTMVCVFPSPPFFFFWSDSIGGVLRPFWGGFGHIPEGIFGLHGDWKRVFSAGDCDSLGAFGR